MLLLLLELLLLLWLWWLWWWWWWWLSVVVVVVAVDLPIATEGRPHPFAPFKSVCHSMTLSITLHMGGMSKGGMYTG